MSRDDMICIRCRTSVDDSPLTPLTSELGLSYYLCETCFDYRYPAGAGVR